MKVGEIVLENIPLTTNDFKFRNVQCVESTCMTALGHTIDLTRPLFIEMTMLSQQSERSSIYVRNIYCASLYGFDI